MTDPTQAEGPDTTADTTVGTPVDASEGASGDTSADPMADADAIADADPDDTGMEDDGDLSDSAADTLDGPMER